VSDQLLSPQVAAQEPLPQRTEVGDLVARVWVALLRGHAGLRRIVAHRLHEEHGLTVTEYNALLLLDQADGKRLRGVDLAAGLQLTPSGVTRLLEGMRERGLVDRVHCPNDGRVTWAVLKEQGERKLRAATCAHVATVRELLADRYSSEELQALAELLSRLPGGGSTHLEAGCDRKGPAAAQATAGRQR
jgi:DNA-binding MarR family transcriptional regulator